MEGGREGGREGRSRRKTSDVGVCVEAMERGVVDGKICREV